MLLAGDLYSTRTIRDAFALVEAPTGMDVMVENHRVTRIGASGRALITDIRANEINRLSLDVDQAPLDARIGITEIAARPATKGAALARFDIVAQKSRWISITAPDGQPAPEGMLLTRSDGAMFFTGSGGRAYVARTDEAHLLEAKLNGQSCTIDLAAPGERLQCN